MLTVYDKRLVRQLNHLHTCGDPSPRKQWRVGEQHDVTSTSGCSAIGVHVTASESDIVRLVASSSSPSSRGPGVTAGHYHGNVPASRPPWPTQQLYLGQRPTDGGHLADKSRRPTSFQPALVRCSGGSADAVDGSSSSKTSGGDGKKGHGKNSQQQYQGSVRDGDNVLSSGHRLAMTSSSVVAFLLSLTSFVLYLSLTSSWSEW